MMVANVASSLGPSSEQRKFDLGHGPLAHFLNGKSLLAVDDRAAEAAAAYANGIARIAYRILQDCPDYRSAIQAWFSLLAVHQQLIIVVPHAFLFERSSSLPSPWRRGQRRLYTPASLQQEVEEALVPNSYRVRWSGDLDDGYDYEASPDIAPVGPSDVALVLERIVPPSWPVAPRRYESDVVGPESESPPQFEPLVTRVEVNQTQNLKRILVLKLDHLGDFIMSIPALKKLRVTFREAEITLVVGSWNASMARNLSVADHVIEFDAFPRNSSEQEANVEGMLGIFRSVVTDRYDLAIDLRVDSDTRTMLRAVNASLKAGIGSRARFPFLDIGLPIDETRNEMESAKHDKFENRYFHAQDNVSRSVFVLRCEPSLVDRSKAIIWGPYVELNPGDYIFDFHLELDKFRGSGMLHLDIALNYGERVSEKFLSKPSVCRLAFRVEKPRSIFEARISAVDGHPPIGFSFYGGVLIRKGADSVLHQSEYGMLLVELVIMRVHRFGMQKDAVLP